MLVMLPTNALEFADEFPERIGALFSPIGKNWTTRCRVPYAIDNGRFVLLADKAAAWDETAWRNLLDKAADYDIQPQWVAVPDMPGDSEETRRLWDHWHWHLVRDYPEWRFAYVVQDGAVPATVPENADVIFIGGTTRWKRKSLWGWCHHQLRPVHVGRINTERWLWECHNAGAQSCDGSGWFYGSKYDAQKKRASGVNKWQLNGLLRYLRRSSENMGPLQLQLELSSTFTGDPDAYLESMQGMLTRQRKDVPRCEQANATS